MVVLVTTKKQNYNYKRYVKKCLVYIARAIEQGFSLKKISEGLREIVNSYEGLTVFERYDLYSNAYTVARAAQSSQDWKKRLAMRRSYDQILKSSRRVMKQQNLRMKKAGIRAMLQEEKNIFFVCSKHSSPAEDHKDYQGRIYVDRFWRKKVSGSQYYSVQSYIKNRNVMTVQEVMGAPVYMTTRPYCKHYFIPVATSTVLHQSEKKTVEEFGTVQTKPYTTYDYFKLRTSVYEKLNQIVPCKDFDRMSIKW